MPGFITAPMGNPYDEPNLDLLPSGVAERVGWAPFTRQIGRGLEREAETGGLGPSIAQPNVDPDALNKQWGVTGPTPELSLKFDSPIPAGVAQEMNEAKHDEIARAYAERRSPGGVGSALADFGFGNLDPAGIAAGLVPVLGEGRMAELLGSAATAGISRLGVRAAEGAASGAAAMAPLTALRYGLSQQEHADYSMSDAARDIAFGALAGGVLHPLFGVLGDTFHPPVPLREVMDDPLTGLAVRDSMTRWMEAKPDVRAAAVEAAVAGVAEDRPVDVAGVGAKAAPLTPEEQAAQDTVARDIGIHGDEMAPGFEPPPQTVENDEQAAAQAAGAPSPTDATTISAADAAGAAKPVSVSTLSPELQSRLQDAELAFQHAQAAGMIRPDDPALTELATAKAQADAQTAAIAQAAFCARNA